MAWPLVLGQVLFPNSKVILTDLKVAVAINANFEGDGEKAYRMTFGLAKKFAGLE